MAKAKERPGVMLYFDLEPALKMLDDSQCGRLLKAIFRYAHYGENPEFDDALLSMAWSFVKNAVDRDNERYETTIFNMAKSIIWAIFGIKWKVWSNGRPSGPWQESDVWHPTAEWSLMICTNPGIWH